MLEAKKRSRHHFIKTAPVKSSICQRLGAARRLAGDSLSCSWANTGRRWRFRFESAQLRCKLLPILALEMGLIWTNSCCGVVGKRRPPLVMYVLMPHMRATFHNGSCFQNRTAHTCDNGQNGLNTPRNITLIASLHVSCATPCVQPAHRKSNTESTRHCYTSEVLASVLASEAYGVAASIAVLWSEPSIRRV
jgi:hypothetical protein